MSVFSGDGPFLVSLMPLNAGKDVITNFSKSEIIACIGDSTVRNKSYNNALQAQSSWAMQWAQLLRLDGLNANANNFFADGGSWGAEQNIPNFKAGDLRFDYSGNVTLTSGEVTGGNAIILGDPNPSYFTFRPVNEWNKAELSWVDRFGPNYKWSWSVDGGAETVITSDGAFVGKKVPIVAPNLGMHTIKVSRIEGPNEFIGIDAWDDTSPAVRILNWGISGANSYQMLSTTFPPFNRKNEFAFYQPTAAVMECAIVNDWRAAGNNAISVAQSKINMTTKVQDAKAVIVPEKIILMTPPFDNGTGANIANQNQYCQAMKEVANEQGVKFLDARAVLKSWVYENSQGYTADEVHFAPSGAMLIAQLLHRAISFR